MEAAGESQTRLASMASRFDLRVDWIFKVGDLRRDFAFSGGRLYRLMDALEEASFDLPGQSANATVLNLCSERYRFACVLLATLQRGQLTLLPSDRAPRTLDDLTKAYNNVRIIDDADLVQSEGRPRRDFAGILNPEARIIAHTSGTQGLPLAFQKSIATLRTSASLIAKHLGGVQGHRIVATVPPQHMYGLELSVLLPLFEGALMDGRHPFYPADVFAALADGPGPCILVTTPFHLRALLKDAPQHCPTLSLIVSATAPMDLQLARSCEAQFKVPLLEVFGCTELGSIAGRRPARDTKWRWFEGVTLEPSEPYPTIRAQHVPDTVSQADEIRVCDGRHFFLGERHADLLNIAGKRSSLSRLRHQALTLAEIEDIAFAVIKGPVDRLAAAYVASPGVSAERIHAQLREVLDPSFMPRILVRTDSLPRTATGKVPKAALLELCLGKPGAR